MAEPLFQDRKDAGRQLAVQLQYLKNTEPLILALPRGGVPVAAEIAEVYHANMDVLLVRKLGTPHHPELAMGAVTEGAHPRTVINWDIVQAANVSESDIEEAATNAITEIARRRLLWLSGRPGPALKGRVVVIVDDGIATGASARAALGAVRKAGAKRVVLASPVAPPDVAAGLRSDCDDAIFLAMPQGFGSVNDYYADFHQLEDDEVTKLLDRRHMPSQQQAAS